MLYYLFLRRLDSSEKALKTANLLPHKEKRRIHEAVFTTKALSGKLPTAITEKYQKYKSLKNNRTSE